MANKKTNPAEVLGYFNDLKQARKGTMMKSYGNYMQGGGEKQCGGANKPKCKQKKKFGKRGGLGKFFKALVGIGAGVGAGALFKKGVEKLKNDN